MSSVCIVAALVTCWNIFVINDAQMALGLFGDFAVSGVSAWHNNSCMKMVSHVYLAAPSHILDVRTSRMLTHIML